MATAFNTTIRTILLGRVFTQVDAGPLKPRLVIVCGENYISSTSGFYRKQFVQDYLGVAGVLSPTTNPQDSAWTILEMSRPAFGPVTTDNLFPALSPVYALSNPIKSNFIQFPSFRGDLIACGLSPSHFIILNGFGTPILDGPLYRGAWPQVSNSRMFLESPVMHGDKIEFSQIKIGWPLYDSSLGVGAEQSGHLSREAKFRLMTDLKGFLDGGTLTIYPPPRPLPFASPTTAPVAIFPNITFGAPVAGNEPSISANNLSLIPPYPGQPFFSSPLVQWFRFEKSPFMIDGDVVDFESLADEFAAISFEQIELSSTTPRWVLNAFTLKLP